MQNELTFIIMYHINNDVDLNEAPTFLNVFGRKHAAAPIVNGLHRKLAIMWLWVASINLSATMFGNLYGQHTRAVCSIYEDFGFTV